MRAYLLPCICAFILLSSIFFIREGQGISRSPEIVIPGYASRLPIRINGDGDFTGVNGITGGAGTGADPWMIEDWDISGHGFGYCIYVGNTTQHFIIRNCRLHDARGSFASYYYTESAVIFYNVRNGAVQGCNMHSNDFDGAFIQNSTACNISNNSMTGNRWGLVLMSGSHNNTVAGNTANGSLDYGIGLIDSWNNRVTGNTLADNADRGIYLSDSFGNILSDNVVCRNGVGICMDASDGNVVARNNITDNGGFGLDLWQSSGNRLHHNNMMDNGNHARDDTGANTWDNGFPSGGNHWSGYSGIDANNDGIGDTAYAAIQGGMGARDRHPLINPWFRDTEAPVAIAGPDRHVDEGTVVEFNGSGSTDNVGVAVYTWAFTFGGTERVLNGPMPNFNFTSPGIYDVTLEARDSAGNRGTDSLTVTVNDITPPIADAGSDLMVDQGMPLILDGSGSSDNLEIVEFAWRFNDGLGDVELQGSVVTHVFHIAGSYTVSLTVSDWAGHADTDTMTVSVIADTLPPVANAGHAIAVMAGETVLFNGSGSTDNVGIVNYTWRLIHNGTPFVLYGPLQEFVFHTPGNYTVVLTVRDAAGNSANGSLNITVRNMDEGPENILPEQSETDGGTQGTGRKRSHTVLAACILAAVAALAVLLSRRNRGMAADTSEETQQIIERLGDGQAQDQNEQ